MARTAILSGDTFQIRAAIKDAGWKWDAETKTWSRPTTDDATPEDVIRGIKLLGGVRNRAGNLTVTIRENA